MHFRNIILLSLLDQCETQSLLSIYEKYSQLLSTFSADSISHTKKAFYKHLNRLEENGLLLKGQYTKGKKLKREKQTSLTLILTDKGKKLLTEFGEIFDSLRNKPHLADVNLDFTSEIQDFLKTFGDIQSKNQIGEILEDYTKNYIIPKLLHTY